LEATEGGSIQLLLSMFAVSLWLPQLHNILVDLFNRIAVFFCHYGIFD
jgi:hypothetical protein